ncbi:MAG: hypothetical protein F6K58_25360 [Symploca sp. SIO2E9]|nr:hypothetical protein [Symploca sp. SIO2E9]
MAELYLYLLFAICLGLLGWGLIRLERVYQYPFFMGGVFVSFILPQAIALFNNPGSVGQQALERVLLMSCLCAAMCWLGYQLPPNSSFLKKLDISIDSRKLLHGGIVFVLISYFCSFLISQLPEAVRENTQWTGIATIYLFFAGLIYPGFTIILLSTLRRPTVVKIIITACAAAIPLQTIILYGRRESTATFILTIGLSLYFFSRLVPPRWLVLTMLLFALIAIPLVGTYRYIAKTGQWNQLLELQPLEHLNNFVEEGEILELRNAAVLMDAAVQTGQYGYGTDYWNTLVFRFVPAQLVGSDLKNALQIKLYKYDLQTLYNYSIHTGTTPTGIADTFIQFDYLGCFVFFILAYSFKNLWISAVYQNSVISQVFYISLFSPSMISLTHGTTRFLADLLFRLFFVGAVIIYSQSHNICSSQVIK